MSFKFYYLLLFGIPLFLTGKLSAQDLDPRAYARVPVDAMVLIAGFSKTSGEWVMIYGGVLAVLLGLLLVFNPILTAAMFVSLLGFFSIVGGIILIVYSLKIRKLKEV